MELVLGKVYDQLKTSLGAEYALIRDVPNELEKLKRLRNVISNVQLDAVCQDSSQQQALSDWLDEMKDAAYDVEDVIDMFNTEILRHRSNSSNSRTTRIIHRVNDFFSSTTNPLIFRHKIGSTVRKTFYRLDDIAKERGYHLTFSGRDGGMGNSRENMHETFSYMGKDDFLGREQDLKIIIERLFKDQETKPEVLVLVGMGGIGKTALAKKVYNDSQVVSLFANRMVWVCVSRNFNLNKIVKLVIEQIDRKPCQLEGLQALTEQLMKCFNGNRYLLVLDDVWMNASLSRGSWSEMKSLFHNCKILVTTREEKVTSIISGSYQHHVGCLSEDVCWSLFKNMAFNDSQSQASDDIVRKELKEIGKKIVKKCKGLPLAVRILGSMLCTNQDNSYWLAVEKSNIFDSSGDANDIVQILKFSYNNLPLESRFCFAYCSIFPKDSVLNKMDLIQQWTDNGFILPNETKEMEHTGKEIFEDLLSRCFFQDVEKDYLGNITSVKMHDLMHDLAHSVAKDQCRILKNKNQAGFLSAKKKIHFLSIDMGEESSSEIQIKLDDAHTLRTLRTLQLFSPQIINKTFLVDWFAKLKFLRVLNCSGASIEDVPSSIDSLKLLRYVDFSKTDIKQLPESICRLQNLQTMKLNFCKELIVLPKKLRKLSKLRHLEMKYCDKVDTMPVGMDQLSLLQTLSNFTVNNDGTNLTELRQLKLGGSLIIQYLERIKNVVELGVGDEIFKRKENLVSLHLSWEQRLRICEESMEMNKKTDADLLNVLQPHANLKELGIASFDGIEFPKWMSNSSQRLVNISLYNCNNCVELPPFGQLRYLRILNLMGLERVNNIDERFYGVSERDGFPSLEVLVLFNMPSFRKWSDVRPSRKNFPKLRNLEISYCQNLEAMPQIPTLHHLKISECKSAFFFRLVAELPSLSSLDIGDISNLTCPTRNYFLNLGTLKKLSIWHCGNLESFVETALKHTSSLQHLEITYCGMLKSLPKNMDCLQSLRNLEIEYCSSLVNVSAGLECLNSLSLKNIKIVGCFGIRNWSNLAVKKICSAGESRIEICSKDNADLLSRWLQNSTETLQSLRINGGHGTGQYTIYRVPGKHVLSICCYEEFDALPEELVNMHVLECLEIVDCPNFSSLPARLNVKYLGIENCHPLEAHCKRQGYLVSNVNQNRLDI